VSSASHNQRRSYASDLSDAQWKILEPLIPRAIAHRNLQVPIHPRREIVNAILYRVRTGCAWRMLPHDFPPWKTVFNTYRRWVQSGDIGIIHDYLREAVRKSEGRSEYPTASILDSQTAKGSVQSEGAGYDAAKRIKGRKRHILVDTLGLLLVVLVFSGNMQDRDAAIPMIDESAVMHSHLRKIWADGAYQTDQVRRAGEKHAIDVEIVKRSDSMNGFVVLPHRWIVERTFGWLERCRVFSREYERTTTSSRANVHIAMISLMLRRLTGESTPRFQERVQV